MSSVRIQQLSAVRLHRLFAAGELSAVEIVEAFLARIERVEPLVGSYITVTADHARAKARKIDAWRRSDPDLPPLAGVPVAVKDNMCTEGIRTTCGSKILADYVPPYNATVVARLAAAGAILIGKTNMDEFAMGSSNENSGFHPTRNPWDTDRVPGGSSGGSAAAVAADACAAALGSDTGGSIRQPGSYCGVVGLKPTYGRVSRYGLVAFASSLDQIGPLTRDVADAALLLQVVAGSDRHDSTCAPAPVPDYLKALEGYSLSGLRIGMPREYMGAGVDPEIKERIYAAARVFEDLGARVEECSLPHTEHGLAAYYVIAPAEASSNLARYDGVRYGYRTPTYGSLLEMYEKTRAEGFGPEVKRRIMLGTYALSSGYYDAYYLKAQKVRTLLRRDFEAAFAQFDLLLSPTTPDVAFGLGEKLDDPLSMYMADLLTIPVNLAGLPAISVPCGLAHGLPVGLQIIARPMDEATMLKAAHAFERATEHHLLTPAALAAAGLQNGNGSLRREGV